jgi:hypothetical protein
LYYKLKIKISLLPLKVTINSFHVTLLHLKKKKQLSELGIGAQTCKKAEAGG